MPTLLYKAPTLVKGIRFDSWRRVGSLMQAIKVYNLRQVDELVFLDISATAEGRSPDMELIDDFADECFMPLTVGGGIKTIEDVRKLLRVGADKVAVNSAAVETPNLISEIAAEFGTQCVVVSIDFKCLGGGRCEVWTHSGKKATGLDPVSFAREMERLGAGEILLTSIDNDGTMSGYDLEVTRSVADAVKIPLIASGGAGSYDDMEKAVVQGGASAIAAASIFHFTQQTPLEAKKYLKERGIATRA
jgi:cyclase